MVTKTETEQLRAEFEEWCREKYNNPGMERAPDGYAHTATHQLMPMTYASVQMLWEAYRAGRAALQSQDAEEIMEMALCESRRLVLRIGQAYRFVPMEGCKTCEELKAEHDQAYAIDHARRVEGGGEC